MLQVPRRPLRDRVSRIDELSGRALPADHPAARVLAAFLRELAGVSQQLTPEQRAELGLTAIDLLATALRATAGEEDAADPAGHYAKPDATRLLHDNRPKSAVVTPGGPVGPLFPDLDDLDDLADLADESAVDITG